MKKVIAQTAGHIHSYRANITLTLMALSLVAAVFYAYNLYTLISRTVAIGAVEQEVAAIGTAMSALDTQYLKLSSNITPDKLSKYGLATREVSMYINKPSRTASIGNLASGGHEL